MTDTIEQMIEKAKERANFYTSDKCGYCTKSVGRVVPSTKRTAIAYHTEGSDWNMTGFQGGGVAKFQGTRVSNGLVDIVVKSHSQWRSSTSASMDTPGNRYDINSFKDLEDGKYVLELSNCYGREFFIVDFENGRVDFDPFYEF